MHRRALICAPVHLAALTVRRGATGNTCDSRKRKTMETGETLVNDVVREKFPGFDNNSKFRNGGECVCAGIRRQRRNRIRYELGTNLAA